MLNCLFFRIFSSVRMKWVWASARYLAFGRTPGYRRLAKCDAGSFVGTSSISFASARARKLIHSAAPPLKIAIALLDCDFVFFYARRCNVGFFCRAAHTLAVGAESRTQRRHAPHGAVQAFCLPTGSIGSMFPTVGRSALSALRSEISRLPLLR